MKKDKKEKKADLINMGTFGETLSIMFGNPTPGASIYGMSMFGEPKEVDENADIKLKNGLTLRYVNPSEKYRKKWKAERTYDFRHVYVGDKKVSDTLYRVGGMSVGKGDYIILLKQVESLYDFNEEYKKKPIAERRHLANCSCILNKDGVEMKTFDSFDSPYLSSGEIYFMDSNYYNIRTGEHYGYFGTSLKSKTYLFLGSDIGRNDDGVMKLNMFDGTFEMIK